MCGIYIHIPFCRKVCYYCNFHFSCSLKSKDAYIKALLKEIKLQKDFFKEINALNRINKPLRTLYFGGGTPSQLNISEINIITEALHKNYNFATDMEFTIEVNPDDINTDILKAYKKTGINRLSIGIQSFNNKDLKYLNRSHTPETAEESIKMAQDSGIRNINTDLIYGIPVQSIKTWNNNLQKFLALDIPHLSAYCLTVEPHTPLDVLIRKKKIKRFNEKLSISHYRKLTKIMTENNYIQYEISNFCKEGFVSVHNSAYWQQKPYLGLGASAHSYNGDIRWSNVSNTSQYIEKLLKNECYFETETLNTETKYNEYVMTSLRTIEGCSLDYLLKHFGKEYVNYATTFLEKFKEKKWIVHTNETFKLTDKGKLFADAISSDLFWVK